LVLARRVALVEALVTLQHERGHRPLVLQGGMSVKDRRRTARRIEEANPGDGLLVVGTTPFIGEGFDAPALDTLSLAAPISFDALLVQCAGRVVRSCPGKADRRGARLPRRGRAEPGRVAPAPDARLSGAQLQPGMGRSAGAASPRTDGGLRSTGRSG
jgi:hypothetical protein